jgi:transcriptional regulator GlxA family with amidase domain
MDRRVHTVIELMRASLHRPLSVDTCARTVNLSESRLRRLFLSHAGRPPGRYLRELRMQEARALLETSFLSVKEIRSRVGIADASHFSRDFRAVYGLSPSRYRLGRQTQHDLAGDEANT